MAAEVVGRAVLPAREGWWPRWVRRLLGRGRSSRRRRGGGTPTSGSDCVACAPYASDAATDHESMHHSVEAPIITSVRHDDLPVYTGPVSSLSASSSGVPSSWASPRGW